MSDNTRREFFLMAVAASLSAARQALELTPEPESITAMNLARPECQMGRAIGKLNE